MQLTKTDFIQYLHCPKSLWLLKKDPDHYPHGEFSTFIQKLVREGSIRILYASMANPAWGERVISPHTLVYTGFRWHARAYCHKRGGFRDFILSRIDRTPKPTDDAAPSPLDDSQWQESIALTLIPNTKLNDGQKALVEKDFGMPDGRLQLSVRKALAHYTLQRYQAAVTPKEANDELQYPIQLLESDRKKLNTHLFSQSSPS